MGRTGSRRPRSALGRGARGGARGPRDAARAARPGRDPIARSQPWAHRRATRVFGGKAMRIDVFTLFPEWFSWFLDQRHVANALSLGHDFRTFNYRDTTPLGNGQVDDSPYGGGAGMVIRVDVV